MTTEEPTRSDALKRRTIVKGMAWTVPVVTMATATPAFAASPIPPNGLNGWVNLEKSCTYDHFTINGQGNFTGGGDNDRGIWVWVNDPTATISGAKITFFFAQSNLTWTNSSTGWSGLTRTPADDDPSLPGFYAYTTTYTLNTWTWNAQHGAWVANGQPFFRRSLSGCPTVTAYARRTVTVNGETVSFRRGPVQV